MVKVSPNKLLSLQYPLQKKPHNNLQDSFSLCRKIAGKSKKKRENVIIMTSTVFLETIKLYVFCSQLYLSYVNPRAQLTQILCINCHRVGCGEWAVVHGVWDLAGGPLSPFA